MADQRVSEAQARPPLDPRLTPARPDLAARHLQGKVTAVRFADPLRRVVAAPRAPLRRHPRADAALDTEALMGEAVDVYETTDAGWCWGQLVTDGYVGWLPAAALAAPGEPPTHRVAALRTLVFPGASIKEPPVANLSCGAQVHVARVEGRLAVTPLGSIPVNHLTERGRFEEDFVAVAERFVGTPYLWGGKSGDGIDCSGLVQLALAACGIAAPRDSDMQAAGLGGRLGILLDLASGLPPLMRGDLLFWKGHVAIARDAVSILHANAHHMAVTAEPLADALARIGSGDGGVIAMRRLREPR